MNNRQLLLNFEKYNSIWKQSLLNYSEKELVWKPSGMQWSLCQLYDHLNTLNELMLDEIQKCLEGKGKKILKNKKLIVRIIFYFNTLPPFKFKVPTEIKAVPEEVISKNEIIRKFEMVEERVKNIISSVINSDPIIKTRHPKLGYFNASDWLAFITIHSKHHLNQKKNIERQIVKFS